MHSPINNICYEVQLALDNDRLEEENKKLYEYINTIDLFLDDYGIPKEKDSAKLSIIERIQILLDNEV